MNYNDYVFCETPEMGSFIAKFIVDRFDKNTYLIEIDNVIHEIDKENSIVKVAALEDVIRHFNNKIEFNENLIKSLVNILVRRSRGSGED